MKILRMYIRVFLIGLGLFACGENLGEGDVYYHSMENKSGKPIVIKSYRSDFQGVTPEITSLAIDEKLEMVFKDGLPPIDVCVYGDLTENFVFTQEDYKNAIECCGTCN